MWRLSKKTFLFLLIVVVATAAWGVVYASAGRLAKHSPRTGSIVAIQKPRISMKFPDFPGVTVKDAQVTIDGVKQDLELPIEGGALALIPDTELAQGTHTAEIVATYNLGVPRTVRTKWDFTVDTEAPKIGLEGGAPFYVSSEKKTKVLFRSEPGARVEAVLNNKRAEHLTVAKDGRVEVPVRGLKWKNKLRLTAIDSVGNSRSILLPVVLDDKPPVVSELLPADGAMVRQSAPQVSVGFNEAETGLMEIKLTIDGTEAVSKGDDNSKKITYLGDLLSDGKHKAKVEAQDYAGHKVAKEWSFTIDSRHIVVSKSQRRLFLYKNGRVQRQFRVAVGQPRFPTPAGNWQIVSKQYYPVWYNPGSAWAKSMPKVIPAGRTNPLGVRALALSARNILIHGTSDYSSIGRAASHGCIRMRNHEIVQLYPYVSVGMPVQIVN